MRHQRRRANSPALHRLISMVCTVRGIRTGWVLEAKEQLQYCCSRRSCPPQTFYPLLSLTSPQDYADIVESYIDGWRKTGQIPECRANNVPGLTQGEAG
jgi:hypothetical protein